ncbi:hypothetical protein MMC08_004663 [Hypocenomyce scalaris]|nr:hypothetical protein [Hypocenomyce scalaris]
MSSIPKPDAKSADPPTEPEQHDQPDSEDNGSIKYGDSDDSDHLEDYIDPKDPDYQPAHRTRRNQGPKALSAGFSCDKCNKHFQSQRARLQHYRTSAAHLVCNHGCNDTTEHASIADLRLHWQRVHRATYCYFCDRHFANSDKRQMHMEREHHPCRQCNLFYRSEDKLREHWKTSAKHQNTYCGICELEFETAEFLILHQSSGHESTEGLTTDDDIGGNSAKNKKAKGKAGAAPADHYATLGISRSSTPAQIAKAAKEMRIKTHPDRLKRNSTLGPEESAEIDDAAAKVGWAADVLCDPEMRQKYDRTVRGWAGRR